MSTRNPYINSADAVQIRTTIGAVGSTDRPVVGEFVPDRDRWNSVACVGTSGVVWFNYFTAAITETISNVTIYTGGTAAAATPTICRMAVFSVDGSGNLTSVGSTANDTTLFAATNTKYTKALQASFTKTAGVQYAVAVIVVTAAATPTFVGYTITSGTAVNAALFEQPYLCSRWTAQTDMPATTVAIGSLAASFQRIACKLT